jgi:hypothetical protein
MRNLVLLAQVHYVLPDRAVAAFAFDGIEQKLYVVSSSGIFYCIHSGAKKVFLSADSCEPHEKFPNLRLLPHRL